MPMTDTRPVEPAEPEPKAGPRRSRRPALIATAIALPVTILLALAFTAGRGRDSGSGDKPAGPLSVAGSTVAPAATVPCEKVSEKLPVTLNKLAPRAVHGPPFVVAWGDPSVVYSCGVGRPAGLTPASGKEVIDLGPRAGRTVQWYTAPGRGTTVWTAIDRAVYIQVIVPDALQGSDYISPLSGYIASALPAVCQAYPVPAPKIFTPALERSLCVYRK
jgi:hypothetical protein